MEKAAEITEMRMGVNTPFCRGVCIPTENSLRNKKYSKAEETLKKAASAWKKILQGRRDPHKNNVFWQAKNQYMLGFPKKASEIILQGVGHSPEGA